LQPEKYSKFCMKRAISMSFLLLAGIFLLAHAVIPHHYHNQVPDFTWKSLHQNDNNRTGNQPVDPNYPTDDCFLKKIGVRFDSNGQMLTSVDNDIKLLPDLMPLFPFNRIVEITSLEGLSCYKKPYLLSCHTDFISQSTGLRAPPLQ